MSVVEYGYDIANPTSAPTAVAGSVAGSIGLNANYQYKVTFVSSFGETLPGPSNSVVTNTGSISLSNIPLGSNYVTARKLYRTAAAGTVFLYVATISDNVTTTYLDTLADGSLGLSAPLVNTASSLQVIEGYLKVTQPLTQSWNIVTANGVGQLAATPITTYYTYVQGGATGGSLILPTLTATNYGMILVIHNGAGNPTISIYPAVGQYIQPLGINTAIGVASSSKATLIGVAAGVWIQIP